MTTNKPEVLHAKNTRTDRENSWEGFKEYGIISMAYRDKAAKRTKLPYMNHIKEGLVILNYLEVNPVAMRAYCLHPIFQEDALFHRHGQEAIASCDTDAVLLAMDYRTIANSYLSKHDNRQPPKYMDYYVKMMLWADKIQNRKDFLKHLKGKIHNSDRLDKYFKEWMEALGIQESTYQELAYLIQ